MIKMATQAFMDTEKTGLPMIDMVRQLDPDKNVAIVAVTRLSSRVDFVRFFDDYVRYLKRYGDSSERQDPLGSAKNNLLCATGYCDEKVRAKWHNVIREITESEFTEILRR